MSRSCAASAITSTTAATPAIAAIAATDHNCCYEVPFAPLGRGLQALCLTHMNDDCRHHNTFLTNSNKTTAIHIIDGSNKDTDDKSYNNHDEKDTCNKTAEIEER